MKEHGVLPGPMASVGWEVTLFGGLSARSHTGRAARFETRKTAELLGFLATHPDRDHARDGLAELLWPEGDARALRHRLSQALTALRRELTLDEVPPSELLTGDHHIVRLASRRLRTDVARFESLLATARHAPSPERGAFLQEAVDLYQGEFLAGLDSDWIFNERLRLGEARVEALSMLMTERERQGDLAGAIRCARQLTEIDPLDEDHAFDLIRLLALDGQTAQALRQYRLLERNLHEELRETSSAATRALIAQVRSQHEGQLADRAKAEAAPTSALPKPFTRFFGRAAEIESAVQNLLREGVPLLTLTGVAGSGKSRLALEIARKLSEEEGMAAWFVSLAEVRTPAEAPDAILHALRPRRLEAASAVEQIIGHLGGDRPAVIVLDSFDHLAEGSSVLAELLQRLPNVRFLVTSSGRLNLEGETELPVPPLSVPPEAATVEELTESPAVQLFVDRARAHRPDFAIGPTNVGVMRALCARLEGIPLALELAASWAHALSPEQMLSEVNRRFDLLVSRRRDIPKRHRTLRAAIEYSFQLLTPDLQRFLAQLSVFQEGFSLEAARTVCQETDSLDLLGQLLDRSLVAPDELALPGVSGMRYRMLDTIREFGWEKLTGDQQAELSVRHADYFVDLAVQAEAKMTGPEQAKWLTLVDFEHRNFVAALHWCRQHAQIVPGLRMTSALAPFWQIRGPRTEGIEWLSAFLREAADEVPPRMVARALAALGHLAWSQASFDEAERAHQQCIEIQRQVDDTAGIATSLYHLGIIAIRRGDYERAGSLMEHSLLLAEELRDAPAMAKALLNLGNVAKYAGDGAAARTYYERSLEIEQSLGNAERVATALNNLGTLALSESRFVVAEFYLQEALKVYDGLQNRAGVGLVLMNLGKVAERQGEKAQARQRLIEGLIVHREVGNKFFMREAYAELAKLTVEEGDPRAAAALLAAADAITREIAAPMPREDAAIYEAASKAVREALDDQEFEAAQASARTARFEDLLKLGGGTE